MKHQYTPQILSILWRINLSYRDPQSIYFHNILNLHILSPHISMADMEGKECSHIQREEIRDTHRLAEKIMGEGYLWKKLNTIDA